MNNKQLSANMWKSLYSVTATLILGGVDHAYRYGYHAIIAFTVIILVTFGLVFAYKRTQSKGVLGLYGLLSGFAVIGFGLVNGFWNHAAKVLLTFLHNGELPPLLQKLFISPGMGGALYEGLGILTFIASLFAGYYGLAVIKEVFGPEQGEE
jgi:hypothetical protein